MAEVDVAGTASTGHAIQEECNASDILAMSSELHSFHSCCSNFDAEADSTSAAEPCLCSSPYFSARIQTLSERRSSFDNEVEFEIESSKLHWTELSEREDHVSMGSSSDGGGNEMSKREAFERLKGDDEWGPFFRRHLYDLEIHEKITEGGQAEIFAASATNARDGTKREVVVKVFKEGYFLQDLKELWPRGLAKAAMAYRYIPVSRESAGGLCWAMDVQLLENDRFTDANFCLRQNYAHIEKTRHWISAIDAGIPLRRAPEILRAMEMGCPTPEVYTRESDVYSYALICHDVVTGHFPFENDQSSVRDCDTVLLGHRHILPKRFPLDITPLIYESWQGQPH